MQFKNISTFHKPVKIILQWKMWTDLATYIKWAIGLPRMKKIKKEHDVIGPFKETTYLVKKKTTYHAV
jgi:hypothetical protein